MLAYMDSILKVLFYTSICDRLDLQRSKCLQEANLPEWIAKEKTILIPKDSKKNDP